MSCNSGFYGDEVLSRRCMILFEMDDGPNQPFFGTVKEYKAKVKGDGSVDRSHYVVFDDGSARWFDLSLQMRQQFMGWIDILPDRKSEENFHAGGRKTMKSEPEPLEQMEIVVLDSSEDETEMPSRATRSSSKRKRDCVHSKRKNSSINPQPVDAKRRLTRQNSSKQERKQMPEEETTAEVPLPKTRARDQLQSPTSCPWEKQKLSSAASVSPENLGVEESHNNLIAASHNSGRSSRGRGPGSVDAGFIEDGTQTNSHSDASSVDSSGDDDNWLDDFKSWLLNIPQGKNGKRVECSEENAQKVIRQVDKLASGRGITTIDWPVGVYFYHGTNVDLSFDFGKMLKEAQDHESRFGEDKDGWELRHPIESLSQYQKFTYENC